MLHVTKYRPFSSTTPKCFMIWKKRITFYYFLFVFTYVKIVHAKDITIKIEERNGAQEQHVSKWGTELPFLSIESSSLITVTPTTEADVIGDDSVEETTEIILPEADLLDDMDQEDNQLLLPTPSNLDKLIPPIPTKGASEHNLTLSQKVNISGVNRYTKVVASSLPILVLVTTIILVFCFYTNRQRFVQYRPFIAGVSLSDFSDTQMAPSSWRSPFTTRGFIPETWNERKYQAQSLEREASAFRIDSIERSNPA